jgi:hypothetical protein
MAESKSTRRGPNFKDLTGQVFGRLTVLAFAGIKASRASWLCRCKCGTQKEVVGQHLLRGSSKSCGCLSREQSISRSTTHGKFGTPEYRTWTGIITRCCNSRNHGYARYGGRGITVCERWRSSFEAFYEDMGDRPSPRHSIERVNNGLGYSKENCVWATPSQQARNRRSNRLLTFNGQTKSLVEWAEELGMQPDTLGRRLKDGWSVERALTTPVRHIQRSL